MKQKYLDYIVRNIETTEIHSLSDTVDDFCEEFGLKIRWAGLIMVNATFTKCLRELEAQGFIKHMFTAKMDRGHGAKGGGVICYQFTEKGYEKRKSLEEDD